MINWVKERHEYWWKYLLERVYIPEDHNYIGIRTLPRIRFTTRAGRVAGRGGNRFGCEYNLNYVEQEQGRYDETICHEICHVLASRLIRGSRHDTLWYYLYNVVCKAERGRFHDYKVIRKQSDRSDSIKAIDKLLKLQKKLAAEKAK